MPGITPIGFSIALAVLAIGLLALVAIRWRGKPKLRAEKWEKAEIMKRLLALSDSENSRAVKAPPARVRTAASSQGMRTSNARLKTSAKTTLPIRPKTT